MGLTTRRKIGKSVLIVLYRILEGIERDRDDLVKLDMRNTRGHGRKLKMGDCRRDIKKISLTEL